VIITEQEILELQKFISQLNSKNGKVIVEGKKDRIALKKLGYTGEILEFHKFGGIINFTDSMAKYENIIILFDWDKKGRYLTRKVINLLQRRTNVDTSYKRKLREITKGKIIFVEQLMCYESHLV